MCIGAYAKTETINWYMDGNTYATTQCETGSDIILPQTPYKYGYTFNGWVGYTPIEYLESTGTQYIDTGYVPNINTEVRLNIDYTFDSIAYLFGVTSKDYQTNVFSFSGNYNSSRYFLVFVAGNSKAPVAGNIPAAFGNVAHIHYISLSKNKVILDGTTFMFDYVPNEPLNITQNLFVFARNNIGFADYKTKMRLFSMEIIDSNTLVRDFIPVLDANGVPCMFDKVERKFYYNAGTGQFVAGPVIGE